MLIKSCMKNSHKKYGRLTGFEITRSVYKAENKLCFWSMFCPTTYISQIYQCPKYISMCKFSFYEKICHSRMHILWQIIICTQKYRNRCSIRPRGKSDSGRNFAFTSLSGFSSVELTNKKSVPPENDATRALRCTTIQAPTSYSPSSISPIPWATSAFSPHNGLLKGLLNPPNYVEAEEKLPERNLDADFITDISITWNRK